MSLTSVLHPLIVHQSPLGEVRLSGANVPPQPRLLSDDGETAPLPNRYCVLVRNSACTHFWYYPTLLEAWAVFRRNRDRLTPRPPRPTLRELLVAEGLSGERVAQLLSEARA